MYVWVSRPYIDTDKTLCPGVFYKENTLKLYLTKRLKAFVTPTFHNIGNLITFRHKFNNLYL